MQALKKEKSNLQLVKMHSGKLFVTYLNWNDIERLTQLSISLNFRISLT